jgi:hypothetical protein
MNINFTSEVRGTQIPIHSDQIKIEISQDVNNLKKPGPIAPAGSSENQAVEIKANPGGKTSLWKSTQSWWSRLKNWLADCAAISPSGSLAQRGRVGAGKLFLGLLGFAAAVALSPIFIGLVAVGLTIMFVGGAIAFVGKLAGCEKMERFGARVCMAGILTALGPAAAFGFGLATFISGLLTLGRAGLDAIRGNPASPQTVSNPG